ncbi:hypothetical protein LRAMOSA02392 [Lichtheimia ramosa]|uniref:Uncharacterized protein n=1 Tax=Lichtheimia ramosa TaxID=688394 RepID=A0A077WQP6_9FUNG|nr:hypothetical protein LRAMOSA02392 [Lichtheimia ramosa]
MSTTLAVLLNIKRLWFRQVVVCAGVFLASSFLFLCSSSSFPFSFDCMSRMNDTAQAFLCLKQVSDSREQPRDTIETHVWLRIIFVLQSAFCTVSCSFALFVTMSPTLKSLSSIRAALQ